MMGALRWEGPRYLAAGLVLFTLLLGGAVCPCDADDTLSQRVERLEQRVEKLERILNSSPREAGPPAGQSLSGRLTDEEMGAVEGVILWRGRPLNHGKVRIVLTEYTGFSVASLQRWVRDSPDGPSGREVTLVTVTDGQGRYRFDKAPPGLYRLYWMPDEATGWIHRMRDVPDFEILPGRLTVQNIPGNGADGRFPP